MNRRTRIAALAAGSLAMVTLLAACGTERAVGTPVDSAVPSAGLTPDAAGAVSLRMEDIKFDATALTVHVGQTVEFTFTNEGKVLHDAFVGDAAAQAEHDEEMAAMTDMSGMTDVTGMAGHSMSGHSAGEPAVTVEPGKSASLSYTFDTPGIYEIGCHQPGHYSTGMKVAVTVV